MKKLLLILSVLFSPILSAQSEELVEFVHSLELGDVYIDYVDTYEESNAQAIIENVDLPVVLEGVKPFRKKRSRLVNFYHYKHEEYIIVYAKWKDGKTTLGVFKA